MKIGSRIKMKRNELGISIDKLAEISGIDKGHISKIENNKFKRINSQTKQRLANALHVDVTWFDDELQYMVNIDLSNDLSPSTFGTIIKYSHNHNVSFHDAVVDILNQYSS